MRITISPYFQAFSECAMSYSVRWNGTSTPIPSTATPIPSTETPIPPTATFTPRPTSTLTPIPWQSYKFTYLTRIGGVGKLWMPTPQEWDGIGMDNVAIVNISPKPDDIYQDNQGNSIAFWEVKYSSAKDYSITFTIDLAPIKYVIDPDQIGEYDKENTEYQHYTQPSTRIESDNEIIIQLAKQIVGNETNPYKKARLIHQWVSENIIGPGNDAETALSVLESRGGGCSGHSSLFIALLRSLGIPARNVSGLHTVYEGYFSNGSWSEGTLHTHVWSEFYLPNYGWIQSDATQQGYFAEINEPRIILSRGEDIELGHNPLCAYNSETLTPNNLVSRAQEKRHDRGTDRQDRSRNKDRGSRQSQTASAFSRIQIANSAGIG
jgi:hypothetical protein